MEHVGKKSIDFQERVKKIIEEKNRKLEELRRNEPSPIDCSSCKNKVKPYLTENFSWRYDSLCMSCKEKEEKARQEEELRRKISEMLTESGLCGRLMRMSFDNFNKNNCQDAYQIVKNYARDFIQGTKQGLFIEGRAGSGKTHLAAAITKEIITQKLTQVRFVEAVDLLLNIRRTYSTKTCEEIDLIEKFSKCQLLVIDDLGTEKNTDWVQQIFYKIINDRYKLELPTIITTNLTLEELEKRLDERVTSRIVEMCKPVKMPDFNYRLMKQENKSKLIQLRIENNFCNSQSEAKRIVL